MTLDAAIDQIYDLVWEHIDNLNGEMKHLLNDLADQFDANGLRETAKKFRQAASKDAVGINDTNSIGENIEGKFYE